MHIACAADEAYVPHCAAMIHSVLSSNQPEMITIHFLCGPDVAGGTVDKLDAMVKTLGGQLVVHTGLDQRASGLPTMGRIPTVMWYRIFLPNLLSTCSRVLYLDCDTLVVDDLLPLWSTDLDGYYVAAVTNAFEPGDERHATDLGLSSAALYFNSGVLLLNLDLMRTDGSAEDILECARTRDLVWPDQDALNLVLASRRRALDPRWNCMNVLFYGIAPWEYVYRSAPAVFGAAVAKAATAHPAILHFEGPSMAKPWHYLNRHPRRADYFRHRHATPWPDIDIEGRNLANRLLRPLPTRAVNRVLRLGNQAGQRLHRS